MNQRLISPLFWTAIIGAIKIVLDTVGIQVIDNQKMDALANGLAAAAVLIGVFVDHGTVAKVPTTQDILDAVTKLVADVQPIVTPVVVNTATTPTVVNTATVPEQIAPEI